MLAGRTPRGRGGVRLKISLPTYLEFPYPDTGCSHLCAPVMDAVALGVAVPVALPLSVAVRVGLPVSVPVAVGEAVLVAVRVAVSVSLAAASHLAGGLGIADSRILESKNAFWIPICDFETIFLLCKAFE